MKDLGAGSSQMLGPSRERQLYNIPYIPWICSNVECFCFGNQIGVKPKYFEIVANSLSLRIYFSNIIDIGGNNLIGWWFYLDVFEVFAMLLSFIVTFIVWTFYWKISAKLKCKIGGGIKTNNFYFFLYKIVNLIYGVMYSLWKWDLKKYTNP